MSLKGLARRGWPLCAVSLAALFDGHRGVACSEFCADTFPAKLADLLTRELPKAAEKKTPSPASVAAAPESAVPKESGAESPGGGTAGSEAADEGSLPVELSADTFSNLAAEGDAVSECCSSRPLRSLLPSLPEALRRLLPSLFQRVFSTYKQVDKEFLAKFKTKASAGCTAVCFATLGPLAVVSWLGDSRAVAGVRLSGSAADGGGPLQSRSSMKAVRLTRDHKPSCPEEKTRIEKVGGLVLNVGGVARVAPRDYEVSSALTSKKFRGLRRLSWLAVAAVLDSGKCESGRLQLPSVGRRRG